MNTTNYEMCRSYLGTIDSVSTEATTLIQSMKAYNADQQGQAKLYIHADGGRDTATLLSQEETNKTIVDHVLGMIILMGQRIGYAPMRKVIAMERSHPGMITALTTNRKTYNNELNYIIKL